MATPTYNAEGQAIWKPQPGQDFRDGLKYAHSYGGVVAALKDVQKAAGHIPKPYPNNFAGIIAAIEDLKDFLNEGNLPDVGAPPPGWEIIVDGSGNIDGDWQVEPPNGSLWFDTRQGRLFIAIDGQYYQTNGADGITHVGENPPTNPPIIGQHWLDKETGVFYVYIGDGVWQGVVSDGDIDANTFNVRLGRVERLDALSAQALELPELPIGENMRVQADYNLWLMEALLALDKTVTEGSVSISDEPPTDNVVPGTLWYDSRTLELSIYYQDENSAQWVPVSVGFGLEETVAPIRADLEREIQTRAAAVDHIYQMLSSMDAADDARVDALEVELKDLEAVVSAISVPDVSEFITDEALTPILNRVIAIENDEVDLSDYAKISALNNVSNYLIELINSKTYLELSDITPLIPDVSAKVEQSDIDTSIASITTEYLPRTGGTLTGSFVVEKVDYDLPGFDFSKAPWYSKCAFKFAANAQVDSYAKFGTTENPWEYAWEFEKEEDFCWIYNDTNKVFSITKDGPACSTLVLGDIGDNTNNGRVIHNKIDVKERLNTYQTALQQIRQGVANATDFDTLKANILSALANV